MQQMKSCVVELNKINSSNFVEKRKKTRKRTGVHSNMDSGMQPMKSCVVELNLVDFVGMKRRGNQRRRAISPVYGIAL